LINASVSESAAAMIAYARMQFSEFGGEERFVE